MYPPGYEAHHKQKKKKKEKKRRGKRQAEIRIPKELSPGDPSGIDEAWMSYDYPFQNIVLSGGGSKGYSFVGSLKVIIN